VAVYFLETSALVKLYVRERGTTEMVRLLSQPGDHSFAVLALSRVELRGAVRRRERQGDITGGVAQSLLSRFEQHWSGLYQVQPLTDYVLEEACRFIDRYPLRAYDSVQLAGCSAVAQTIAPTQLKFVCSDQQLLEAATSEGISTVDPAGS
jgi:predicted nucleic acid-binding protein